MKLVNSGETRSDFVESLLTTEGRRSRIVGYFAFVRHDSKGSQEHRMNLSKQSGVPTSRVNYAVSVMITA